MNKRIGELLWDNRWKLAGIVAAVCVVAYLTYQYGG